jgi:hypothetical protein
MLKTTLSVHNNSSAKVNCVSVGARIRVPANSTVSVIVDKARSDAIVAALASRYPALVVTDMGDFDDGVAYPYEPFVKHKLIATTAPAVTNDETEGYSIGSIWVNTSASPQDVYMCVDSTEDAAVWKNLTLDDQPFAEKTPVNAVAAARVLTVGGLPAEGDTVSAGGVIYKFRAALGAGAKAAKILTLTDVAKDTETVTIDETVYTFVTALSDPAVPYEVLVEVSAELNINNLVAAATGGAGAGTKYGTGTVAHTTVDVTKGSAATIVATAKAIGFAGNSIAIDEDLDNGTWAGGATVLSGGVDAQAANDVLRGINAEASIDNLVLAITAGAGAGTNYGTGTVVNPLVTAVKANSSTMTCTNKIKGVIGNSTVIGKSGSDLSWASSATALAGGVNGTVGVANETCADASYIYHAISQNTIADANWRRIALGSAY